MSERLKVEIKVDYRTFRSAADFRATVERLLLGVSPKYLEGLDCVILRDSGGFTRNERKRSKRDLTSVLTGAYHRATASTPPRIHLFIDNIVQGGGVWLWIPAFRELLVAGPLFHELGHHIQEHIRPEHKDREATAEAWSKRLGREYFATHRRRIIPVFKTLSRILKVVRQR